MCWACREHFPLESNGKRQFTIIDLTHTLTTSVLVNLPEIALPPSRALISTVTLPSCM